MLTSPPPFIFPPFFFFIYNKENSCIINELGKYFQNHIDLQSKCDLYFITSEKPEEMHIFMNKVTRFTSALPFQIIFQTYIYILTRYLKDTEK